uniref:Telomeric single stranded DNA binding POT1/Cdc13 domain-containing protein n=2 Tax=Kalanchoe fedtschenkoi TaxID=63787 RepID=A0A7N0V424_KALFE
MEDEDDYRFLRIADAMSSIGQNISLIGIVADAWPPKKSTYSDFVCTLIVVDESFHKAGLTVNVYGDSEDALPSVKSVGDIVIFTHIKMQRAHFAFFRKRFSSFALYEGNHGIDFTPYQVSANFHPTDRDKKFVAKLRKSIVTSGVVSDLKKPLLMKETREAERCTMICKVLHIQTLPKDERCVFVWDGTDASPLCINNKLEEEICHPLPLHLETFALPIDTMRTFPPVGTILRMVPSKGVRDMEMNSLVCDKWFKLADIILEVHAGLWQAVVMPFTRLLSMSNEDPLVIKREECYNDRVSNSWGHMPFWCFPTPSLVTDIEPQPLPVASLREILTYRSVTAKFKCVVRVVALLPWCVADFRNADGIYRLRLTLEDATARIHAFVYAEDGEQMFGKNPSSVELKEMRNKFLGIKVDEAGNELVNIPRNPPWIECYIKSYYLDKKDPWVSRRYRMYGSEFKELVPVIH